MNRSTQLSDESDFYQLETEPLPSLDIPVVQLYTALPACVFDRLGDIDCLRLINKSQLWANSLQQQLGNAAWQVL